MRRQCDSMENQFTNPSPSLSRLIFSTDKKTYSEKSIPVQHSYVYCGRGV